MPYRLFILFFLSIFLVQAMIAQPQIEQFAQLSFKEGLSYREVWQITQDSKGFMWIATSNGLNRYTASGFEIFDNNANHKFQLHENSIQKVCEMEGGKLALINDRKDQFVEILDLESFESNVVPLDSNSGITGNFETIYVEPGGKLLALAEEVGGYSIFQMNQRFVFEKLLSITFPKKEKAGNVKFIKTRQGGFWVMDDQNGLTFHSAQKKASVHFNLEEIKNLTTPFETAYITSILHEDINGRVWVAFPNMQGLLKILPDSGELVQAEGFPKKELYSKLFEDTEGNLLIGTFLSYGTLRHLYFLDKNNQPTDAKWILDVDDKINHIHGYDFNQSLYLGTFAGIYSIKMKAQPVHWLLADKALDDGEWDDGISIRSMTGDGQGNIYIARELKTWYKLHLPTMQLDSLAVVDAGGKPVRLWCNSNIVYDTAGFLWGGSCADDLNGLLHRFDLKSGVAKTFPIANREVNHIVQLKSGELLLASGADDGNGLLLFFDPINEVFTHYLDADGSNPFVNRTPQFIHVSKDGKIWAGTIKGLVCIDRKEKKSNLYSCRNSKLANDNIITIHEADDGRLMLGTYGGLNIFDAHSGKVESYDMSKGLSNNMVCGILPDEQGNYFISTYYGLSYFDTTTKLFANFYIGKGLTFNEFNRFAYYKDEDSNYYFGTLNGVNVFEKNELLEITDRVFPLQWTKVTKVTDEGDRQVWDNNLAGFKELVLRQGDDFARFEFTLPYYALPQQNQYALKLEGIDSTWRLLKNTSSININRPPPGKYRLRVKAAPAYGAWLDSELTLDILVKQAVYQRPWFQVALPLAILLLSYLASRWYIARIKHQEEKQTAINKKFAELELQALQAQMNPHFIFNALGAVQYFIQKNKVEAADNYLAKFAKLMRLFLESSKNKYMPLAEEIKLLSLYIELEQMRYDHKFGATINVDESIDVHFREIPSILIQPFVENAINHGLFHKKGKGQLAIDFMENENGALTCTVQDDGVGRRRTAQLKEQSNSTHKSRGMQIVHERLEVLQHVDEISIIVTVDDLYPDKEDTGTVVRIEIPDLE